ncbi:MAG: phosphoribosylglycinamide formyltransferase [Spirochaetales bacterium]|nr:phosphoribosylglycinamide formyltransferase [Spirochaetales bacterium]
MGQLKLGFLASHNGSNMQAVIDACRNGNLDADPVVVISNNPGSMALTRARAAGIPACHVSAAEFPLFKDLDNKMLSVLTAHKVNLVILAGYMKKTGPRVLACYKNRILNIHPAMLPKYGGKGMYGIHVHEAVIAAGEKVTGVTVHLVDAEYDTGRIISQCRVPVLADDDAASLAARVLEKEHRFLVETLQKIIDGRIPL